MSVPVGRPPAISHTYQGISVAGFYVPPGKREPGPGQREDREFLVRKNHHRTSPREGRLRQVVDHPLEELTECAARSRCLHLHDRPGPYSKVVVEEVQALEHEVRRRELLCADERCTHVADQLC